MSDAPGSHRETDSAEPILPCSAERLRQFIEQCPASMAMFDERMRYLAVSGRWRHEYGLENVPLQGLSYDDVFPETPERWKAVHRRCLEGAVEQENEDFLVRADGRHMWLRWQVQPWRMDDGRIGGVIVYSEDITARKDAELALRNSEARLRIALDASAAGTWHWDARSGISVWDDQFHAQYGLAADAPRTFETWITHVHDDDRAHVLAQLGGVRDHGHGEWDVEFRSVRPDGSIVWHHGRGRAERDEAGALIALTGIDLDITAKRPAAHAGPSRRDEIAEHIFGMASAQGILSVDAGGHIVTTNAAIEAMFGWPAGELIGQPIEALVPSGARQAHVHHRAGYDAAPRSRPMGQGLDLVGQRRDGTTFPVEISLNHVATASGSWTVAFVTDVSVRKQAEATEHEQARLASLRADVGAVLSRPGPLRRVLQDAAEALVSHLDVAFFRIWTLNDHDRVLELEASAGLYTHLDGPHGRVPLGQLKIGRIAANRTPHLTNAVVDDPEIGDVEWARREGMVSFAGYPLIVNDRVVGVMATFARRPLSAGVLADLDAVGTATALCIERKRMEAALRASEERLTLIIDNAGHGLWEWEVPTGRAWMDDRWYAILGYTPGEVAPSYELWADRIHPDDRAHVMQVLQQHLDGRSALCDVDYRAQTKHGEWIWLNTRGRVSAHEADGRPVRMMGTIHDITVRKTAEAERLQMETDLQHTQKLESLGVLAGGIAHDFNNLLMGVLGNATLALDDLPDHSPAKPRLHAIENAATRAAELTQQMLAYAGKGQLVRRQVRLDRLLEEMHALLTTVISKKADMQLSLGAATVQGDPGQLRQVAMNLLTNASEALGDEVGVLRLRTGVREVSAEELRSPFLKDELPAGRYAYLEIDDSGRGIPPDVLPRIFEPFFTTKFTGRGLGLAAVLGIVRTHGGTVTIDTARDRGTTFRVFLPEAEVDSTTDASTPLESELPQKPAVLVVDDEEIVRDFVTAALRRAGMRVLVAPDGQAGLATFAAHQHEIGGVLLDLTMPHLDGAQVLRSLRSRAPDLPVLIMSGYASEDVSDRLTGLGASGFVKKPLGAHELVARVQSALRRPTT